MNPETLELLSIGNLAARCGASKASVVSAARRLGIAPALIINGIGHFDAAAANRIRQAVAEDAREALPGPGEGNGDDSGDEGLAGQYGADARAGTIRLDFYLPRLDDEALRGLRELVVDCVSPASLRLGEWLDGILEAEQARRQSAAGGADVDLPAFPVLAWTDPEVGGALGAAVVLLDAVQDDNAREFIKTVATATVALAASRLQQRKP